MFAASKNTEKGSISTHTELLTTVVQMPMPSRNMHAEWNYNPAEFIPIVDTHCRNTQHCIDLNQQMHSNGLLLAPVCIEHLPARVTAGHAANGNLFFAIAQLRDNIMAASRIIYCCTLPKEFYYDIEQTDIAYEMEMEKYWAVTADYYRAEHSAMTICSSPFVPQLVKQVECRLFAIAREERHLALLQVLRTLLQHAAAWKELHDEL
jgi:hypothetical protein